jgi:hypothetical protein
VFKLEENAPKMDVPTGETTTYSFAIRGQGNISAIREPELKPEDLFRVYPPNVEQSINSNSGLVYGMKRFDYFFEFLEPGTYDMKDYFSWVYFNTRTEQYDTLRATSKINVTGESMRDAVLSEESQSGIYASMDEYSNALHPAGKGSSGWWYSVPVVLLVGAALFWTFRKATA